MSNQISGSFILKEVLRSLSFKKVVIVTISNQPNHLTKEEYATRQAVKCSTKQKKNTFEGLNFEVVVEEFLEIPTPREFRECLKKYNDDESVTAIIVQKPFNTDLQDVLTGSISFDKDIDSLVSGNNIYETCATAEAIFRVVNPFLKDPKKIAVLGAGGFVGGHITTKLASILNQNHSLVLIDGRLRGSKYQDNPNICLIESKLTNSTDSTDSNVINHIKECNIIISTIPDKWILNETFVGGDTNYQLVVDSAFIPISSVFVPVKNAGKGDEIFGSLSKKVQDIPNKITPVPGGIGPLEMAVLAERLIKKEFSPDLRMWELDTNGNLSSPE